MKQLALLCALGTGLMGVPAVQGAVVLQSFLSGSNTVPASGSSASGVGTVVLSDDFTNIFVSLQVFNLTGFATSAGIYGPAFPGQSGPLLFPLSGIAFPPSQTSFSITGFFFLDGDQAQYLLSNQFYFNVYSTAFPEGGFSVNSIDPTYPPEDGSGGELRGQIIPEPGTLAMVFAGFGLCYAGRRRMAKS